MNDAPTRPSDENTALDSLRESVAACRRCPLCDGRTQVVFGVGSPRARLLFVGEAPGFHEDRQGEPFVGQAGKLLDTLLGQIGLSRADVYIANVIKCRPPENRDPTAEEIEACSPYLLEQIAAIRPAVICTLGRFAAKLLTGTELSMTIVHGKAKPMTLAGVELVVFPVFHPAAALYNPANRVVLEEDFAKLGRLLERGLPGSAQANQVKEAAHDGADGPGAHTDRAPGDGLGTDADHVSDAPPTSTVIAEQQSGGPHTSCTGEQLPLW
ncbi:MAG: uracil-DNA glycosylase family protein [Thermoleophilia bacterium]